MIEDVASDYPRDPLSDIINTHLNRLYDEAEDNICKEVILKQVVSYTDVCLKEARS